MPRDCLYVLVAIPSHMSHGFDWSIAFSGANPCTDNLSYHGSISLQLEMVADASFASLFYMWGESTFSCMCLKC